MLGFFIKASGQGCLLNPDETVESGQGCHDLLLMVHTVVMASFGFICCVDLSHGARFCRAGEMHAGRTVYKMNVCGVEQCKWKSDGAGRGKHCTRTSWRLLGPRRGIHPLE